MGGSCSACNSGCTTTTLLSQGKTTSQSSLYNAAYPASKAIDGNISNFNHTNAELQPWWQVDLGSVNLVSSVEITYRGDCCGDRIKRFLVFVSSSPVTGYSGGGHVYEFNNSAGLSNGQVINIPNINISGRYVRVWADNTGYGNNYLHLAEVKVMGCSGVDPCINNQSPTISINSNASSYPQGSSFTVNALPSDPGGAVTQVEFYDGLSLIGVDNSAPFSHTVSPASANSYSITAKAIDDCNASTTSNQLSITTTSTCFDSYKNGNETGVDCGGSCDACSQSCTSAILLSQGKTATQSSLYNAAYPASKAIDGIISNFNHTNAELQPWWQVDLGSVNLVSSVEITNRTSCCGDRIKRFRVFVSSSPVTGYSGGGHVYEFSNPTGLSNAQVINVPNVNTSGRYIRIWVDNTGYGNNYLHLAEVKVMGCASSAAIVEPVPQLNPSFSSKESGVKLFPNPTRDMIHVQFENVAPSSVHIQVYDLQGRILHSETTVEQKVNISNLAAGTYLLHIHYDQKISMHKIVKT